MQPRVAPRMLLVAALLLLSTQDAAAQPRRAPSTAKKNCGGPLQPCCAACDVFGGPVEDDTVCDQYVCDGAAQCYTFADAVRGTPPDGTANYPLVCLNTPRDCGRLNRPCCYNPDPSSTSRCVGGLTCVVEGPAAITYGSYKMYLDLKANPLKLNSTAAMGTCRNVTRASCGKLYGPCGGAARALGCSGAALWCPNRAYCASPGDTRLGEARCLPLPPRCGTLDAPCCPGNARNAAGPAELDIGDKKTPVPFCTDPRAMCVWQFEDYADHGTATFEFAADPTLPSGAQQGGALQWDGFYERGYGRSRCAPAPPKGLCGGPGQACCPSIVDRLISGMVHNRNYTFQPCNYRSVGRAGIYCNGAWQADLLKRGTPLGVCTANPTTCGTKVGGVCCVQDIPEVGPVAQCQNDAAAGEFYCTERTNVCTRCPPKKNQTEWQLRHCNAFGG